MIVASAIKFHIEATNSDVVLCGLRHSNIFEQLNNLGFKPKEGYKEIEQGFIDNNNNFLTRKEAYLHALVCDQLHSTRSSVELFSEDLW